MRRYFIGLMVPGHVQDHLSTFVATIQHSLPSDLAHTVAWTHPADLHCTLLFIGNSDDELHLIERMTEVAAQLQAATLTVEGTTHWLGRNSLAVEVTGANQLGTAVVDEMHELSSDSWAGRRPFHGHVTIGRIRTVPVPGADLLRRRDIEPLSWRADHLHLVRSAQRNSDRKYETVAEVPLGHASGQ